MSETLTVEFRQDEWPQRPGESGDDYAKRVLEEMGHEDVVLLNVYPSPSAKSLADGESPPDHRGPATVTVEFRGRAPK